MKVKKYNGPTKNIVIVGGGIAGVKLAKVLVSGKHDFTVTLISPVDYSDISWATMRSISNPSVANQQVVPYDDIFKSDDIKIVRGKATKVLEGIVTIDTGAEVKYDVLVLATGSSYSGNEFSSKLKSDTAPTVQSRVGELKAMGSQISSAKSVLVVGMGMSGVEAAGEIAHYHPNVKVTLVNRSSDVVGMMPEKIQKTVTRFMKSFPNVEMKFGVTLDKNKEIPDDLKADVVIWTIGLKPNTDFLKEGLLSDKVDENGFVKVDVSDKRTSFQVLGLSNVFAIGDISAPALLETPFMSGYHAENSSTCVVNNIVNVCYEKPVEKGWLQQKGGGAIVCGPNKACGVLSGKVIPQFLLRWLKGKDLFCRKYQGGYGVKIPYDK